MRRRTAKNGSAQMKSEDVDKKEKEDEKMPRG